MARSNENAFGKAKELIEFGDLISKEIRDYKNIPACFQEIKNKLLKAKPFIEKKEAAKYKKELSDYYNKKLLPIIENIKKYEELFNDMHDELT